MPLPMVSVAGLLPLLPWAYRSLLVEPPKITVPLPDSVWCLWKYSWP